MRKWKSSRSPPNGWQHFVKTLLSAVRCIFICLCLVGPFYSCLQIILGADQCAGEAGSMNTKLSNLRNLVSETL